MGKNGRVREDNTSRVTCRKRTLKPSMGMKARSSTMTPHEAGNASAPTKMSAIYGKNGVWHMNKNG